MMNPATSINSLRGEMMGFAARCPSCTLRTHRFGTGARRLSSTRGADDPREAVMNQPQPVKDASPLYEVERRAHHAERPGFRITELQLSATQKVPWHTHTNVSDTFYVLEGHMRLFLQDPK